MKSVNRDIKHAIVDVIPLEEEMEQEVIYVKWYDENKGIAIHKCMCGCGEQTVMPFMRKDFNTNPTTHWGISFINGKIDFEGSIGNYSFPCKSHYMIQKGQVRMFEN